MNAVLTTYPLSREFKERLEPLTGADAIRLTAAELRQHGLVQMLRKLRHQRLDTVFLPCEDENARALLPVLSILGFLMRARRMVHVAPDLSIERIGRLQAFASIFWLVRASIAGRLRLSQARSEVKRHLSQPRLTVKRATERQGLFLNGNLWFGVKAGGSVGHISGVVNGLLDHGYGMTMASAGGRMLVRQEADCAELAPPAHFGLPWEVNFYRFHFLAVRQVLRLARQVRPAFIYQRMSVANYAGVPLSRALGVPLILEYNGSEAWVARNWGRPLRYQQLAEDAELVSLQHAHLVVTISDVLRDELLERGVPAERIVSYPNCIDPATFDPQRFSIEEKAELRSRYGIAPDALVATFVGTFGQWHGAEVLARAVRILADTDPDWLQRSKLHVLFVGDGVKMPDVRAVLGDLVQGSCVTLAGLVPQHEAPLHLAASDILVSPHVPNADGSRFFGSPTKLFEYLAMEKAILASDLDQIGEVLEGSAHVGENPAASPGDNSVALLATPGSAEDIAAGLKYLAENPRWRAEIGTRARALAMSRYTWQHHVGAILDAAKRLDLLS